jgi:riboflavin synthase
VFTGLIEEVGRVRRTERAGTDLQRLEIAAPKTVEDLAVGDSISINGACQTAVAATATSFTVESVAETLRLTTLGSLKAGDPVNLERSLRPTDRMGGHIVLGHVDGVGSVRRLDRAAGNTILEVQPPKGLARYIADKGSITVDGISLTVVSVGSEGAFTIAIIPHTLAHTNLQQVRAGDRVNLEVDVVARYVERLLATGSPPSGLSLDGLRDMGY